MVPNTTTGIQTGVPRWSRYGAGSADGVASTAITAVLVGPSKAARTRPHRA